MSKPSGRSDIRSLLFPVLYSRDPRETRATTINPYRSMKLKLDLHDIFNKGDKIEQSLDDIFEEAHDRRAEMIEIIPGKGSGQLKKKVIRYLERKDIKQLYHRYDVDNKNFGRLFVHFRWKEAGRKGKKGR